MSKKNRKTHPEFVRMTPAQLVGIREQLGYTQEEMAGQMETAISTYQDWEAGRSRIPGAAKKCAQLLLEKDRHWMAGIDGRTEERLASGDPRFVPKGV